MTSALDLFGFLSKLTAEKQKLWDTPPVAAAKDEVIVSPELPSNDAFFILKGEFEVSTYSEKGKIVFYRSIGPGDLFGELAAIDDRPRAATVKSLGDGQLIRIAGADLKNIVETSPDFGIWLVRRHTALIRSLTSRLYEQIAYDVSTRILAELIRLAEGADILNGRPHIKPMPPHHVLAAHIGTTREAVTRELNHLGRSKNGGAGKRSSKKGENKNSLNLIEQHGREVIVHDLVALKRLLRERTTVP